VLTWTDPRQKFRLPLKAWARVVPDTVRCWSRPEISRPVRTSLGHRWRHRLGCKETALFQHGFSPFLQRHPPEREVTYGKSGADWYRRDDIAVA
jgi:hypothetical protein